MKIEDEGVARLEAKLDTLIRLLALSVTADLQSIKDRAVVLSKAGLGPREIAALCDTTPNTVSVALSNAKKDGKSRVGETRD
jgi:DNA-directed RNA polymerase specialized sigma24 family protein